MVRGSGVLWRKRRWSLKVTLHYSTSVSNCSELYRGGGALALKVTWHNSLEFGNASSLLVHSCCCCTSSLDWTGQLVGQTLPGRVVLSDVSSQCAGRWMNLQCTAMYVVGCPKKHFFWISLRGRITGANGCPEVTLAHICRIWSDGNVAIWPLDHMQNK